MTDIFISYSRKDIAFARVLHQSFKENGFETWIDWQDIPPSADWLKEVYTAIEAADTFVFILSGTSTISEICQLEVEHAKKNNKRIIPIVINDVESSEVHPVLATINWIFSRNEDEFQQATESLIIAIQTDFEWVKAHTRLQVRALEWERANHDKSFLLHGTDLRQAEDWIAVAEEKAPEPTLLQTRYLQSSRQEADKRQRRLLVAVGTALVITIILGIIAMVNGQRAVASAVNLSTQVVVAQNAESTAQQEAHIRATQQTIAEEQKIIAEDNARRARAGELAAYSLANIEKAYDLAMLLGIESYHTQDIYQARSSLLKLLQFSPPLSKFMHHGNYVKTIAFSPNGKTLASGSENGTIILWDIQSGQPIGDPLHGHTHSVNSVAYSPDGKVLASGSYDHNIILWDVTTGLQVRDPLHRHLDLVQSITFSPDGKTLASGGNDRTIILWDVASGQPIGDPIGGYTGLVLSIAFSPDGKTLASGQMDGDIILWDVTNGKQIGDVLRGHAGSVSGVSFSPDGRMLASGSFDNTVLVWDVTNPASWRRSLLLRGHTSLVNSIAFSPDGTKLASGSSDNTIILWDAVSGQPIGDPLRGHASNVSSVAFSSDGKVLASGSSDNTIILWDVLNKELWDVTNKESMWGTLRLQGHTGAVVCVAFSPDGNTLATGSTDRSIILWDIASGQKVGTSLGQHSNKVSSLAFSPDGMVLASGSADKTIILWDVTNGLPISEPLLGHDGRVTAVGFSPDGKVLASGDDDKTITLWDVVSRQPIGDPLRGHINTVNSVTFSPDGKVLASGGNDKTIILWDVTSGLQIGEPIQGGYLNSVTFSPDGMTLASGGSSATITLWDVVSRQPIGVPLLGHTRAVNSVAFSPDGHTLASGSADNTIILWDVASKQPIGDPLHMHIDHVNMVAFSPDGKVLASGSTDYTTILWIIDPDSWRDEICKRVGRNLTAREWSTYFIGDEYRKTCPQYPRPPEEPAPTFSLVDGLTAVPTPTPIQQVLPTPSPGPVSTAVTTVSNAPACQSVGQIWERTDDGMTMVCVPAGEFQMGSFESDEDAEDNEKPLYTVTLDADWIDRTEVTVAQFRTFVLETGHWTRAEEEGWGYAFVQEAGYIRVNGANWQWPNGPEGTDASDDHPVVQVNWNDAMAYCAWVGGTLPTEAQWEKAARGTDPQIYPWGNNFDGRKLNYCDANCPNLMNKDWEVDDGYAFTAPVGSYPDGMSPFGALDMAGNVFEWVADWYKDTYYRESPSANPTGPPSGEIRVIRGGTFLYGKWYARVACRNAVEPIGRGDMVGFRCVVPAFWP